MLQGADSLEDYPTADSLEDYSTATNPRVKWGFCPSGFGRHWQTARVLGQKTKKAGSEMPPA